MLVLARREGQGISIGDHIKVVVIGIKGAQVKIGVRAPGDVAVHRDEVYARIVEQNRSATTPTREAVDGLREPEGLVRFETARFGTVEVTADKIVYFKSGLLGFEALRRFTLLATPKGGAFRWMQSLDDPLVALLVAEARSLDPAFRPRLSSEDLEELGFGADSPRTAENELVLVTVTIPPGHPEAMRANFQGPIVINADRRAGKQVVIVPERDAPGVAPTAVQGLVTFTVSSAATAGAPPPAGRPAPAPSHGATPSGASAAPQAIPRPAGGVRRIVQPQRAPSAHAAGNGTAPREVEAVPISAARSGNGGRSR